MVYSKSSNISNSISCFFSPALSLPFLYHLFLSISPSLFPSPPLFSFFPSPGPETGTQVRLELQNPGWGCPSLYYLNFFHHYWIAPSVPWGNEVFLDADEGQIQRIISPAKKYPVLVITSDSPQPRNWWSSSTWMEIFAHSLRVNKRGRNRDC